MRSRLVYSILGLLSGLVCAFFLSALFLSWPIRTLLLAILLGLVSITSLRRAQTPRQGWGLAATWFTLGYALFAAVLVALDIVWPPLT